MWGRVEERATQQRLAERRAGDCELRRGARRWARTLGIAYPWSPAASSARASDAWLGAKRALCASMSQLSRPTTATASPISCGAASTKTGPSRVRNAAPLRSGGRGSRSGGTRSQRVTWTRPPSYVVHADVTNRIAAPRRSAYISRAFCVKRSAMPNKGLERSVTGSSERAAGARTIVAPAARWSRLARPAQRGGGAA